ncbi:MAG TPA: hydantoinase B/oxoprolinase family protein [Woeseiaceae bacterium]|nr:hydantoinase B/oxoprolinase family protein [Woeseiaceae bacterium]
MTDLSDWQFWIDRGGTFTDVVALRPDGSMETAKLLSEDDSRYPDAAAEGIRRLLRGWSAAGRPDHPVAAVKMGTTVATNALLQRRGRKTALVVTQGFADSLAIGYQNRPDIFALEIVKPEPLYSRVLEAAERVTAEGEVLVSLDEGAIREALEGCAAEGIDSVAICLLHGYRWPEHERRIARIAAECGMRQVSASHEVEPLIKFVSRAETTLVDAYLTPVLLGYIESLRGALAAVAEPRRLLFMQSNGGLVVADRFRGKDSVLSGPAAGVVGMVETARIAGLDRLIGFDMGGTSTDVSAWSGEYERDNESMVAGVRLRAPMMKIHTIASGGGSLLRYGDGRYQVGPESAGADPGPASYRRGGPLTITDANLLLGRIPVDYFPRVFGPAANEPLDPGIVQRKFAALAREIAADRGADVQPEDVAAGFLTVAVETMANAIRKITIERGFDARDFTLCCFGGAGGQHACQVAAVLGIDRVWLHPLAGVLSAYGMGLADIRVERQQSIEAPFADDSPARLREPLEALEAECDRLLEQQNVPAEYRQFAACVGLRVRGSDTVIDVVPAGAAAMRREFERLHHDRFGTDVAGSELITATVRVEGTGIEQVFDEPQVAPGPAPEPAGRRRLRVGGAWREVPVYHREALAANAAITGPAIVVEAHGTTVIDDGWRGRVNQWGHLLLDSREAERALGVAAAAPVREPDPVRLEVFNRLFMHIAEQMGSILTNTALSVNIRERLDFSCALFDAEGRLVSNAPHMPVHLGSMGESVRRVIAGLGDRLKDGDAIMQNSPYNGGTHLPDITVVTPWFAGGTAPRFFLASRAHHADVGGITPGSMPSASAHIEEEGVLIDNFHLVRQGRLQSQALQALLAGAKYPPRNPGQNLADLKAQLAANRHGIRQLRKAVERFGLATVQAYLGFVRENAAASVRRLLGRLPDGAFAYELDSGDRICVRVSIDRARRAAVVDFTGTAAQSATNFNAPEAVTRAAVLYVFRTLVAEEIPMNEGCLEPLEIVIPKGSLLSPAWPAAVVAGNVETSQCVTDALYGALGALAGSQGTMNNVSFGNERVQYYETIAGGAGAGPGWHGADAVQTHMTNSRMTDPEVLEQKFPVFVESFAIREGSGGDGRWRGGNGAVRRLRFRETVEVSVLSGHRRVPPFGLNGGLPGQTGANRVERADGRSEPLGGTATTRLDPGDCLLVVTPGGGGYGKPR